MNSNAEPPAAHWKPPVEVHSNASASPGQGKGLKATRVTRFRFPRRTIPLDNARSLLRLFEDPVIEVNHSERKCTVLHWGVDLPLNDIEEIPRTLGRRFLELFSKSDAGALDEQEEMHWIEVVSRVDYQAFCADREAARYIEGVLLLSGEQTKVEWHDGQVEILHALPAKRLAVLNPGDRFGGWVKWDRENRVTDIEGLKMLVTDYA